MDDALARQEFTPTLWRRFVAGVRLILLIAATAITAITLAVLRLLLVAAPTLRRRVRGLVFRHWSRTACAILGIRTTVTGTLPNKLCIIASNHLSYLDIVVMAQYLPAVFVSKRDVTHWPVIGWLTRLADTLYISRENHRDIPRTNADIAAALQQGDNVVIFPEGTSSDSDWVLPIRAPLLQTAASGDFPVTTAAVHFVTDPADPPARLSICYFGDMVFAAHVWRLLHLRGASVDLRLSGDLLRDTDRKSLAKKVRHSILNLQSENRPASPRPALDEHYAFEKYHIKH
ncbi:MAG: lysophospholipid acyltransferase family protein [Pseudomonadota bacterium]